MAYLKKVFPEVKEFFFDDDTFTANLPRAREIAKKIAPLGLHWSCNSRANIDYDTIKLFKDNGLRLFLVGYESGNDDILTRIKKGVTMAEMRQFTKDATRPTSYSRHVHPRPAGGDAADHPEHDGLREGTRRVQHPGFARRAVSRHGALRNGQAERLVHQQGQDRPGGDRRHAGSTLEYPGLSKDKIAEEVDRFYRGYYMRPKPILRIVKTMLEDKDVLVRRSREGFEFFKNLSQRKTERAARAVPA